MKTTNLIMQTLSIPCNCHCRYCLLSWDGKTIGADYRQCEKYAKDFYEWLKENRPDISFMFAFGYSMEHPSLFESLDFLNSINSPNGRFLQMDGMNFRSYPQKIELMQGLKSHGVNLLNFTFYGTPEYHDRFAGRPGDYAHMIEMIDAAHEIGLEVSVSIPLTKENTLQVASLLNELKAHGISDFHVFVPHEEGRGITLSNIKFSLEDYEMLDEDIKPMLNRKIYKTEAEWLKTMDFEKTEKRALIMSLMPENFKMFQQMAYDEVIAYLEKIDDDYYEQMPSIEELARMYGNPTNQQFFRQRDLYFHYQRIYIKDKKLTLQDISDERFCCSRRY